MEICVQFPIYETNSEGKTPQREEEEEEEEEGVVMNTTCFFSLIWNPFL